MGSSESCSDSRSDDSSGDDSDATEQGTMVIHDNISRDLFDDSGSVFTDASGAGHRGKHNNKTVVIHVVDGDNKRKSSKGSRGSKGKRKKRPMSKKRKHHSRQQTQASNLMASCNAVDVATPREQ